MTLDTRETHRYLVPMGRRKSGLERIIGGLTSGAVVWALWYFHVLPLPVGVILFLGVFFGVLPVLTGLRHLAREISDGGQRKREALEGRQNREVERRDSLEKTVLQIAKDRRGVVTPALVVLHSDLQLAEAEKVLQDLSARGYAEMRLKDNGTIDYVFHDLV